jgi:hypothetical protein
MTFNCAEICVLSPVMEKNGEQRFYNKMKYNRSRYFARSGIGSVQIALNATYGPAFYGTQWFITAFTTTNHLSLTWTRPIQSMSPHPASWRCILILSCTTKERNQTNISGTEIVLSNNVVHMLVITICPVSRHSAPAHSVHVIYIYIYIYVLKQNCRCMVKVKITLVGATKTQRGIRAIALLIL